MIVVSFTRHEWLLNNLIVTVKTFNVYLFAGGHIVNDWYIWSYNLSTLLEVAFLVKDMKLIFWQKKCMRIMWSAKDLNFWE